MSAMASPWWMRALCAEVGPEVFFPEAEGDRAAALRLCRFCPVQKECFEDLIPDEAGRTRANLTGIRAGLTPHERHRLLSKVCPHCRGPRDRQRFRHCSKCAHLDSHLNDPMTGALL